jgi:hypothetical protein
MVRKILTLATGAAILSWVAFVNGYPLLFTDTYSYLVDGINLVRLKWPDNQRDLYFTGFEFAGRSRVLRELPSRAQAALHPKRHMALRSKGLNEPRCSPNHPARVGMSIGMHH